MNRDALYDTPKKAERVYIEGDILAPIFRAVYSRRVVFYKAGEESSRFSMAKRGRQKVPVLVTIVIQARQEARLLGIVPRLR